MTDPIRLEGDPVLRLVADRVPDELFGTDELTDIIRRMTTSLRAASNGVAIAAPQIGISYRIFVVRGFVIENHERNDLDLDAAFINPRITKHSRKKMPLSGEGCLSVPDVYGTVERHEKATVEAYDVSGKRFTRGGSDLLAEIFQHEIDHLEGILFIDKATDLKKEVSAPESGVA
ncbi:MAG: peptide deformylase [Candidatus Paceibacteria bacterium]